MSSNICINLGKLETTRLLTHPFYNIHAIISKRKAILINEQPSQLKIASMILDEDKTETFMCLEFAETSSSFLIVAGKNGILKVIDIFKNIFVSYLKGHGSSVNSLKVHTIDRSVIFSGSSDLSIRMWDLQKKITVCIFGGVAGHRDQILSLDVSLCGKFLVSSSNDCTVKIWKIPLRCEICNKFRYKSHNCNDDELICIYFPIFSSSEIHRSFISCVRFFGEFVIAKGSSNRFVMFKPFFNVEIHESYINSDCLFIQDWQCVTENLAFKFFVDLKLRRMIVGSRNKNGEFFDIDLKKLDDDKIIGVCNSKNDRIIREVSIKDQFYYILYEDSLFQRIKRR
ncbi:hypothetical protein GVAV_001118 [Gurleya vavrai]